MGGRGRAVDAGIGPWVMSADGTTLVRVGDAAPGDWPRLSDSWSRVERIAVEPTKRHRVVLVGESVARGFLLDPVVMLAGLCEDDLRSAQVDDDVEVVDLAVNNLSPSGALVLCRAAIELGASAVVLHVGNNFLRSTPWLERDGRGAAASALRDDSYPAYLALRRRALADLADRFRRDLDTLVVGAGIRLIVVVPAVNLLDWQSPWVVPTWLTAADVADWLADQQALTAIPDTDRSDEADARRLELSTELIRLDGGTTARPLECAGQAMARQGRVEEGLVLLDLALSLGADPANYHRRCPAEVSAALRALAASPGRHLVDVPARLVERYGDRAFGQHVFLDYCHHTVESLRLVAELVGVEVRSALGIEAGVVDPDGWPDGAARDTMSPRDLADSYLLSALHNQHWGQSTLTVQHWIERAFDADPSAVRTLASYYAMSAPDSPFWLADRLLDPASERWHWFLKNFSHLSVLDGELAARAQAVLPPAAAAELGAVLARAWQDLAVEAHDHGVDLLDPFWPERDGPPKLPAAFTGERSPVSTYGFVTGGDRPLRLELVVAAGPGLPAGTAVVCVNGVALDPVPITPGWTTSEIVVESEHLRTGANELTLRWPAGEREWAATLDALTSLGKGPESLDLARLARLRLRAV